MILKFACFQNNTDMMNFIKTKVNLNRSMNITNMKREEDNTNGDLFQCPIPYIIWSVDAPFSDLAISVPVTQIIEELMKMRRVAMDESNQVKKFVILTDTLNFVAELLDVRVRKNQIPPIDDIIKTVEFLKDNTNDKRSIDFNRIIMILHRLKNREEEASKTT